MLLALPLAAATPHPDIVVSADGTAAAVRAVDERLRILGSDDFSAAAWLRADGDGRSLDDPSVSNGVTCDRLGCVSTVRDGKPIALALRPEAFVEDCRRAAIVVSGFDAPRTCAAQALVIDGSDLASRGSHALYRTGEGYRIETAYPEMRRPFMPPRADQ
jgi:competence protein ComEC